MGNRRRPAGAAGGLERVTQGQQSRQGSQPAGTERQRKNFGAALSRRRRQLSLTQGALGEALGGVGQSAVSQWERGETQPRAEHVYAAEQVLGFAPGGLSRLLGYLPPTPRRAEMGRGGVREAIRRDPRLTRTEKRSLLALYESLVAGREGPGAQ